MELQNIWNFACNVFLLPPNPLTLHILLPACSETWLILSALGIAKFLPMAVVICGCGKDVEIGGDVIPSD